MLCFHLSVHIVLPYRPRFLYIFAAADKSENYFEFLSKKGMATLAKGDYTIAENCFIDAGKTSGARLLAGGSTRPSHDPEEPGCCSPAP